ncbi:HAUS augmin-like complex subunit 4 [Ahaetulla prasina]|uniref:HAUS augmin-like complex subunit 4 n=1 Tax=Ahaetulla prasina TaxID=499056 RepID=UPI0026476640|nr:HAUS augmin-like complex subunit 4 [Ahaetulla prasina]XP_058039504.1 HAUS augmin-like complex subunit 4 [Ahaetulla prasina]
MAASEAVDDCRSRLPLCSMTDDDLSAYPGLANLLMGLKKHIDPSGMTIALAQPLEEARKELQMHRANWLKWEAVHRLLQEALLKLAADPSLQDKKFLETLEQQLLVVELKRMLDRHSSPPNARPSVLGLESRHLTEFLPPHQDLEQMQKHLPAEVEKFLKAKCLDVLSYYRPESGNVGAAAQMVMLGALAESLATEKQHLKEARSRHEELIGYLEQQRAAYPQVLLRCLALLKRMAREFHLGIQSELDQVNIQYMEIKCTAMLLKIRFEELKILSETYTPEIVKVHRMIRDKLQGSLSQEEQDLATSRKFLSNYEILGPEFEELVKEYTRLQEIIQNRRWVLAELNKD